MTMWKDDINSFIRLCNVHDVRMLMVGGGAVNYHGYQRSSSDIDFWIDTSEENLGKLVKAFTEMGYELDDLPDSVKQKRQNISIKLSPLDLNLELITNFSANKSFDEAYQNAEVVRSKDDESYCWRVLAFEDLVTSKIKSGRPKDLLDVYELKRRKDGYK